MTVPTAMPTSYVRFGKRTDRPRFLADLYGPLFAGSVLDVGCDEAALREFCPGRYVGLDIGPHADVRHDLVKDPRLPFEDRSFDTVVCLDVLEHMEALHALFDELVRVSGSDLLVSLPNNWNSARKQLRRGHGSIAHYGLPPEPPVDRHRWFFNLTEARDFLCARAERNGLDVVELRVLEKPRPAPVRALRHLLHPRPERYRDLFAHTLCAHLRRRDAARAE